MANKIYLRVYPTPATSEVSLIGSVPDSKVIFIEITDATGSVVFKDTEKGNEYKRNIDVRSWQGGAYFVHLSSDVGASSSTKIIISH